MSYTTSEILKMEEPGELFSDNIKTIKDEYVELAKIYHPDRNKNSELANDVMAKIGEYYTKCLEMIDSGIYIKPGSIKLKSKDGKLYEVKYRISHSFELGTIYVGNTVVLYLINNEYKNLFENLSGIEKRFTFADEKMKSEFERYLPRVIGKFETLDSRFGIVVKKTPDMLTLKDVLNYYDGKMPVRHVAWIISSLMNLVCYINYTGMSHNSISLDTYFISPKLHSGSLLGGWWYSVPLGDKMLGVTEKTYSIMPPQVKSKKNGDILTDLESIRLIGRELLGDRNGTRLLESSDVPDPMVSWLRSVASGKASEEYSKWSDILYQSFGKRKFVKMEFDEDKLYLKIKNKK